MGKLTVKKVESLTEPGRYSDGDGTGFHLRIDPQGRKYWVLRAHVAGKRKDINLGSVARTSLSTAREQARRKRDQIEQGETTSGATPTFAAAAILAHRARTVGYRNAKHTTQWISTLETHANPVIGDKPVDQVSRADVVEVLTPIWLKTPETARRVLQRIDRVMRWSVGNNHRSDRIDMSLVRDALPPQNRKRAQVRRMPSIDKAEAPAFWSQIQSSHSAPEIRFALSLLMLTAVRPGNIRLAKRAQFDLDQATWTIPADEMKAGEALRVPLAPRAVQLISTAMALHERELIFSVSDKPMSPDTLRMTMRRMGRPETPHGFRSTFKEWSRSEGWADHLSEAALAHQDPNEVRAAYARSDLLEERRPMMISWAAYLEETPRSGEAPSSG